MKKWPVFHTRVYIEDTDMGGRVYHAKFLHFGERARTEGLLQLMPEVYSHLADAQIYFVVTECSAKFLRQATVGQVLNINTTIVAMTKVRIKFDQTISCGENLIAHLHVNVACVNYAGALVKIPVFILKHLEEILGT